MHLVPDHIEKSILIASGKENVWRAISSPELMKEWMAEPEMKISVSTEWNVNENIIIIGFHHGQFINKGTVLSFIPNKELSYSHLSSVSRLPDVPENYTLLRFTIEEIENKSILHLKISGFPTESIYRHLEFYWGGTLLLLKQYIENKLK